MMMMVIKMKTKDKIKESFLKLYCSNDIEQIKVNEICEMAKIGRTTFYKYYKNTDDILSDTEKEVYDYFNNLKEQLCDIDVCLLKDNELAANILGIYQYIYDERLIFKAFFNKNKDHLIIIKVKKKIRNNLKDTYYQYFNDDKLFDCFSDIISTLLLNNCLFIVDYYNLINIKAMTIKTQNTIKDLIINKDKYFSLNPKKKS